MPSSANRAQEWPAGANDAPTKPLYSRPGVIQTSRPPVQSNGSKKTES